MSIVCIIENEWFGDNVCEMDGFIVLHSGHNVLHSGDAVQCVEGVAIVVTS